MGLSFSLRLLQGGHKYNCPKGETAEKQKYKRFSKMIPDFFQSVGVWKKYYENMKYRKRRMKTWPHFKKYFGSSTKKKLLK